MGRASQIDRVTDELTKRIFVANEFRPGDRLPPERQLAAELHVSRNTLRESINGLRAKGVLTVIHGSGIYVNQYPGIDEDPYSLKTETDKLKIMDTLYEARLIIEPEVAALVAERGTDEDISRIAYYKDLCDTLILSGQKWSFADQEFHASIARASGNAIFERFVPSIHQSAYMGFMFLAKGAMAENALMWHQQILAFIQRRDPEGSRLAMRAHLLHARAHNLEFVRSRQQQDRPLQDPPEA